MAIDEQRRSELFRAMAERLGEEPAITMFELLPPAGTDLATRDDIHAVEQQMETLRHELIGVFRAELRQVAAGHTRAMVAAMATTVVGIGGLGLAFAQLL